MALLYLHKKWWKNRNQNAWWYWCDPWALVRVSGTRYRFERASPVHQAVLAQDGWTDDGTGELTYYSDDASLVEKTLTALGLPMPTKEQHQHRVYWREPMYYI